MAKKKKEEKRGRKHPEGFTKSRILLLALDYPEGIKEPDLVEEIRNNLGITEVKGIKGHLADLGEGRIIAGREKGKKRKAGKKYLIKESQLGKENIWTPNPDFGIFHEMALEFLDNANLAVPFMRTEYTQRMVKEHIFDLIKKRFDIDLSTSGPAEEELKFLVLTFPPALLYLFRVQKITEEGEKEVIPNGPGIFRGTFIAPFISSVLPIIPTRGKESVEILNTALTFITLTTLELNPKLQTMFDEEDLAKLRDIHDTAADKLLLRRPDIREELERL